MNDIERISADFDRRMRNASQKKARNAERQRAWRARQAENAKLAAEYLRLKDMEREAELREFIEKHAAPVNMPEPAEAGRKQTSPWALAWRTLNQQRKEP
jgi:hypothetical protein